MTLTKIEQYAYGGNCAHFVAAFDFDGECVGARRSPVEAEGNVPETVLDISECKDAE